MNGAAKIRDIMDGTSNSILICEKQIQQGNQFSSIKDAGTSYWATYTTSYRIEADKGINVPDAATGLPQHSGAGSFHEGGCHALLGDGAVRFLSENLNLITFENLCKITDGLTVGEF